MLKRIWKWRRWRMLCDLTIRSWGRKLETEMFFFNHFLNLFNSNLWMWFQPESDSQINGVSPWASPQQSAPELFAGSKDPGPQFHRQVCIRKTQLLSPLVCPGHTIIALFILNDIVAHACLKHKEFVFSFISAEYKAIFNNTKKSKHFRIINYNALVCVRYSSESNFDEREKSSFLWDEQQFIFFALGMIFFSINFCLWNFIVAYTFRIND